MSVIRAFKITWCFTALINIDLMNNQWLLVSSLGSNMITTTRVMTRTNSGISSSSSSSSSITIKINNKPTTPVSSSSTTISRLPIKICKCWIKILGSCSFFSLT